MSKIKNENQILIMLAFFSISMGLWENFRQLWLQSNGFSVANISNIISLSTLVSVFVIFLVGKSVKLKDLRKFITFSLIIKFLNLIALLKLNNTQRFLLLEIVIIIDVVTGYLITTSIYPFITTIVKNNTIYSKRKLTEYLFKDIGVFVGGLLIGKHFLGILVNYNVCLLISIVFLGISIIFMFNMTTRKIRGVNKEKELSIVKYIISDKLQIFYMLYILIGHIAYSTALGLKMLVFTNCLNFTDSSATKYLLVIGLIADGIGILALKYFTPKNDYITITIKFVIRFLFYTIAFLTNSFIVFLIAITWAILISTAYENICEGYYINAVSNEYQFRYTNFRYILSYLGDAIGVFFGGLMYNFGVRYMLGLSALFMIFQIALAYYLINLKRIKLKEEADQEEENKIERVA